MCTKASTRAENLVAVKNNFQGGRGMGIMNTEQESIVTAVVERLSARPEPPRQRWLRSEAASLYVTGGFDALHLEADRRESKREGRPPKFPFRKYGSRVLYDV